MTIQSESKLVYKPDASAAMTGAVLDINGASYVRWTSFPLLIRKLPR